MALHPLAMGAHIMTSQPAPESDRVSIVLKLAVQHMEYARQILHDLINSDPDHMPVTAIAAEQAVEMDLRHAVADTAVLTGYIPTMGGAV
jgi:hypothetical protein